MQAEAGRWVEAPPPRVASCQVPLLNLSPVSPEETFLVGVFFLSKCEISGPHLAPTVPEKGRGLEECAVTPVPFTHYALGGT